MKKTRTLPKLTLSTETLRDLQGKDLAQVNGGGCGPCAKSIMAGAPSKYAC
jgi:hypothetical protein